MPRADKKRFIARVTPFDRLDEQALGQVVNALTTRQFRAGEKLLQAGEAPAHLYIIATGGVQELDQQQEIVSQHSEGESFDAQSLLKGCSQHDFIAGQDTYCYLLPKAAFLNTTRNNSSCILKTDQDNAACKNLRKSCYCTTILSLFAPSPLTALAWLRACVNSCARLRSRSSGSRP